MYENVSSAIVSIYISTKREILKMVIDKDIELHISVGFLNLS